MPDDSSFAPDGSAITERTARELVESLAGLVRSGRLLAGEWSVPSSRPGGLVLTTAYFPVMRALGATGEERVGDLAEQLRTGVSVVSRQLSTLEVEGYVRRRPEPSDRRVVLVSLTDEGRSALRQMDERRFDVIRKALVAWTESDAHAMIGLTDRVRADLDTARP